jgi:hypothetical protein
MSHRAFEWMGTPRGPTPPWFFVRADSKGVTGEYSVRADSKGLSGSREGRCSVGSKARTSADMTML